MKLAVDLIAALLKEVDVVVEQLDKQLNLHRAVHALVADLHALLQAVRHPLAVMHLKHNTHVCTLHAVRLKINGKKEGPFLFSNALNIFFIYSYMASEKY